VTEPPEVPLTGGTLNPVVRVGDTVRRPTGPWTPSVHALLRHVRARGFALAPEPLGLDDTGREVLRYIPGDTVGWSLPWPEWIRSMAMLESVGRAAGRFHAAAADFRPSGSVPWRGGTAELGEAEIVCHHDLAPYNVVVSNGRLAGIIDWDLAGPGTAVSDLAFVAWQWVPLHSPRIASFMGWPDTDRAPRLARLLDAYGLVRRDGFIEAVQDRMRLNRRVMLERAAEGDPGYQALVDQGHIGGMDEALEFLAAEGPSLQAAL
jgi:hypothetical protein